MPERERREMPVSLSRKLAAERAQMDPNIVPTWPERGPGSAAGGAGLGSEPAVTQTNAPFYRPALNTLL